MRLIRTTILALAAAGTALALAAPASQAAVAPRAATCTKTICRIVIYKGAGNKTPVGPATLPGPGGIEAYTAPQTLTVSGAGKMEMDIAGLEGPYGACASDCSEWWYYSNAVQVTSFSWVQSTGTQTAHYLASVPVNSAWKDLGNGVWTPLYLTWQPASGLHCAHLSLSTYDWKNVSDPAANCP
jgi:hypothetical protein